MAEVPPTYDTFTDVPRGPSPSYGEPPERSAADKPHTNEDGRNAAAWFGFLTRPRFVALTPGDDPRQTPVEEVLWKNRKDAETRFVKEDWEGRKKLEKDMK